MPRQQLAAGLFALVLSAALSPGAMAQTPAAPESAAKQWLALIDSGAYAESWDQAGSFFKARISSPDWQAKVAPFRDALGPLGSRETASVTMSNSLPGAPDGTYEVMRFNSVFARKKSAIETVTLSMEDSKWAVVGYFVN